MSGRTGATAPAPALGTGPRRHVRTAELMGTVASAHVLTAHPTLPADLAARISQAQAAALDDLHEMDALFSPFRPDSQISLLRDGAPAADALDPRVLEVAEACVRLASASGGRFDANWQGWFDPTGYVKGWAVERAARRHLAPLLGAEGVVAAGLSAGGDMQLLTAPGADWTWSVGIADPFHGGELLARVALREGAVATSGTSERGAHIVDPRSAGVPGDSAGAPGGSARVPGGSAGVPEGSAGVLGGSAAMADAPTATVIAEDLSNADAWATVAVVAGFEDLTWLRGAPDTSGMLIASDGRTRRWAHGVEIAGPTDWGL